MSVSDGGSRPGETIQLEGPYGDVRDVLAALPYPPASGFGTSYALTDLFTVRHRLIKAMNPAPKSVWEFGALYGYFLVTSLSAQPDMHLVGWVDNQSNDEESNKKCIANLESMLEHKLHYFRMSCCTDREDAWGQWDLVQVDGDHSYEGCRSDLEIAARLRPLYIMLDDWTAGPHTDAVQSATMDWLGEQPPMSWELTEHETVNGLALLRAV